MGDLNLRTILSTGLDIALIYIVIYRVLMIIKGTRAVPMLIGLMAIAILYGVSQEGILDLPTFNWLLEQFIGNILIIVIVVFQADIRRALAAFGQTQLLSSRGGASDSQVIDELVKATTSLANQRIGALIVLEREADLSPYMEEGTRLDAKLSKELLYSLFVPERQSPLHDGAVIVQDGRLATAGVFLPMSVNAKIDRAYGTRHRAALGLSEETDALVLVVSEERGTVSVAVDGGIDADIPAAELRTLLTNLMIRTSQSRFFRRGRTGELPRLKEATEVAAEGGSGSETKGV